MSWSVLGDSMIGTSHRMRSTPCQDAFKIRAFGPSAEWLVVAVADGAGSASHAEVGATITCEELVRRVETLEPDALFTRDGIIGLFTGVRSELIAVADTRGIRPRDLACTALLAIVGPESATFAQLGDGAIVIGSDPEYGTVFWPEPAEYANATDFLTDDQFAHAIQVEMRSERITELAVLTDGLQRLALDFAAKAPHLEFFRPLFRPLRIEPNPEPLREPFRLFLDSPRVNERTDDDKTLVLAIRRAAHDSAPTH